LYPSGNKTLTKADNNHFDSHLDNQLHENTKNSNTKTTRKELILQINNLLEKADIQTVKTLYENLVNRD